MRPFEMGPAERQAWAVLEGLIDVIGYQNETPVLVRQLGQVTQARPLPRQIILPPCGFFLTIAADPALAAAD
jgi:hypothetical protein